MRTFSLNRVAGAAVFSLFVAVVVGYAYFTIQRIDDQYSSLIDKGISQLRIIQRLSFDSNRSYILLFMAMSGDKAKAKAAIDERNRISNRNTVILDSLRYHADNDSIKRQISNVISARIVYLDQYQQVVNDILEGRATDYALVSERLEPPFKSYQQELNKLFQDNNRHISTISDDVSAHSKKTANTLLLVTLSPIVIISLGILVVIMLIYFALKTVDTERA